MANLNNFTKIITKNSPITQNLSWSPFKNLCLKKYSLNFHNSCLKHEISSFWGAHSLSETPTLVAPCARIWRWRASKSSPCEKQIYTPEDNLFRDLQWLSLVYWTLRWALLTAVTEQQQHNNYRHQIWTPHSGIKVSEQWWMCGG